MTTIPEQPENSVLFITLDSCRYDTFAQACVPNMRSVGRLYKAMSPGNFTYSSHAAMFVGFTPGIAELQEPYINPKYSKIFKMVGGGFQHSEPNILLQGKNIIDGFNRLGFVTLGTSSIQWFNPDTETGKILREDFQKFWFCRDQFSSLSKQMDWLAVQLEEAKAKPVFCFINVAETHVPYYFKGAPWDPNINPCIPFSANNNAAECLRRQKSCLEYVDTMLEPLLSAFRQSNIVICADHGDCWGENGLWEHGIFHQKVHEVPMIFRLSSI